MNLKAILFPLLFISSILFAQDSLQLFDYTKGGEYEIADIRVEGAKYLDSHILVTLSGLAKGDKIKLPGEQIPKAIKALSASCCRAVIKRKKICG